MKKHTTSTAIPTYALKAEALASMSASFERFCLAAGLETLSEMLERDATAACGERHERGERRQAHRWGRTKGKIGFHGGKVEIERPRVRGLDGAERVLPSWENAVSEDWLGKWAMNQMLIDRHARARGASGRCRLPCVPDAGGGGQAIRRLGRHRRGPAHPHRGRPISRRPMIAADLRKRRLKPHTTWHLDEVYLKIDGRMVYLWRAVDAEGEVLDVLIQSKRNKHAALKLMRKLLKKYAFVPERLVTDDLRSYSAAVRELGIERHHERGRWKNNRAENSHQPTRRRERKMQRFKSPGFSPEISFHTRRRLQYLQRPTPSPLSPNAPRASRCGDDHVADRGRSGLTSREVVKCRVLSLAT